MADRVILHPSWKTVLESEFKSPYMTRLRKFLKKELTTGKSVHPPMKELFAALDLCPLDEVRVVIIGQDPYHGPGQAHGLCFSVKPGIQPPPSLMNIIEEINSDLGKQNMGSKASNYPISKFQGCLVGWAQQGVLLLNSVLTVLEGRSGSHQGYGWEKFTDRIVQLVNEQRERVVFLLWGRHAQEKGAMVDRQKHCVLEAPHPSPLSVNRGFFGCRHFSKTNQYLIDHGQTPIDWSQVQ